MSRTSGALNIPPAALSARRSARNNAILPPVTPEARRYAVKELARRAGVSRDFFEKWIVDVTPERTSVSFGSGFNGQLHFNHLVSDAPEKTAPSVIPVALAKWAHELPSLPDLILPFCHSEKDSPKPLYQTTCPRTVTCRLDLLRSFLYTL